MQLIEDSGAPYDFVLAGDPRTYADLLTPAGSREHRALRAGASARPSRSSSRAARTTPSARPPHWWRTAHAAGLPLHPWTFRAENHFLPREFRRGAVASRARRPAGRDPRLPRRRHRWLLHRPARHRRGGAGRRFWPARLTRAPRACGAGRSCRRTPATSARLAPRSLRGRLERHAARACSPPAPRSPRRCASTGCAEQVALHADRAAAGRGTPAARLRSTPSATTCRPSPWHSATIERTIAAERGLVSTPATSSRSSFTRVIGSCSSEVSEE